MQIGRLQVYLTDYDPANTIGFTFGWYDNGELFFDVELGRRVLVFWLRRKARDA